LDAPRAYQCKQILGLCHAMGPVVTMIISYMGATASATIKYLLSFKITYKKQCKLSDLKGLSRIEIT